MGQFADGTKRQYANLVKTRFKRDLAGACAALLKNRLYRRWGIKTAFGKPDFTTRNAPAPYR